jgi:hypothetical protein
MYQIIITHLQERTAQVIHYQKLDKALHAFKEICNDKGYDWEWTGDLPTAGGKDSEYKIEINYSL